MRELRPGHLEKARVIATRRLLGGAAKQREQAGRRPSRTMTVLGWIAVIAVCLYVGLAAMLYFAQRSLMYFPDTGPTRRPRPDCRKPRKCR